ncbi:transcriptional regulator [Arthrobacter sp. SLBN-112]|nr:transcriptional regulator [Arthrobacter sp. SLBN-112]
MADPPLERRSTTPSPPGLLRPRLMSAPQGVFNPRLRLAVGPPGTGKTTLLTQWAAHCPGDVVWYQSGSPDVKPGKMFSFFACALGAAVEREPASSFPDLARAAELLDRHFYFVVDDLHLLAGTSLEEELEQIIAVNSPHMHFLIGSRHFPRINMAKSELRNAFSVFGDDLRFRDYEIEQLFRTTFKHPLSVHGISNLAGVTDGWAAALHLFHLAATSRSNLERRRAAESLNSRSRFAGDYLVNHFLVGTTLDMNRLLSVTSLLDFITPSRCDALLERHDSRVMLHRLEHLGIVSTDDDGATYRMPKVLRQYLLAGLEQMEPEEQVALRLRTAAMLELEGAVGEGLRVLAEGGDWESVKLLLARAGTAALQPGRCGWAASIPDHVLTDDAWVVVARSREMLDDGRVAAAEGAAARIPDLTTDPECLRRAEDLRLQAALWSGGGEAPSADTSSWEFRKAIRGDPCAAARSLGERREPEDLFTGLSLLLAGDQRSALPLLIRCAERLDMDPVSALAAQLALAVAGHRFDGTDADATAAEVDSVHRQAERRGFTWLARLAGGMQAALSGTAAAFAAVNSAIKTCEDRGDEWGAALIAAGAALLRLRTGAADLGQLEALARRFRRLSAGTLEAWAWSAEALVSANLDLPCAPENAQSAAAFARTAGVPGALAVAYAAMALQKPEAYGELMRQAAETAQSGGLVCRPWTWLAPCRHELVLPSSLPRDVPNGNGPSIEHSDGNTHPWPERAPLPSLQITCLGGFALSREKVPVDLSRIRPQARTVLRILCLNAGRLVHRERLAGILWPDLEAPAALHALQVSLSCLRGVLQHEGQSGGGQLLVRQGAAYALVLGTGSTSDLADFEQSLHAASLAKSAGNTLGAAEELRRAVGLYSGEVLPEDGPADWVSGIRESYRQRAAEAAATLASVELSLGNTAAAAAAATRSVEIDPWRDESWRTLVDTFWRLGDPAAAQRAQRRYDLVLNSLGVTAE